MKWILIVSGVLVVLAAAVVIVGALLPKAHVVSREALFHQPPEALWAAITDARAWRPSIHSFEELPDLGGHKMWREVDRRGQKITYERTEADPPRRMVVRIADRSLPFGGSWTYTIQEAYGGARLTITENGEVYNPLFRFVSRFITGHSATIEGYLRDLSQKLEQEGNI